MFELIDNNQKTFFLLLKRCHLLPTFSGKFDITRLGIFVILLEFVTHGHAFLARLSGSAAICRPLCLSPHSPAGCSAHTVKGKTPSVQGLHFLDVRSSRKLIRYIFRNQWNTCFFLLLQLVEKQSC